MDNTVSDARQDFTCLAVDLGAESGRVAALSFEGEGATFRLLHRFGHAPLRGGDGLHWDLNALWEGILAGLRLASGMKPAPRSMGVDSWGVDTVLVDAQGTALRTPYSYRDPRSIAPRERLLARFGERELFRRNGLQAHSFNTIFQMAAHAQAHPEDFAAAHQLLLLPDYLHRRLGGRGVAERSNASTTGLLKAGRAQWDPELADAAGLPARLLAPLASEGESVGRMDPELASGLGLARLELILPPTHDTAAAVAAVPAQGGTDWAYLSSGTWSLLGCELPAPLLSDGAFSEGFANEGGVDGSTRFLKNIMGLWLLQRLRAELAPGMGYPELMELVDQAPACAGLVDAADPAFLDPPSMARALGEASGLGGAKLPSLLRCALDSLVLEYRHTLGALRRLTGRPLTRLHIVGGGSQNRWLCQRTADACGVTVLAGPAEAAALGNALIQARALGRFPNLAAMRAFSAQVAPPERYEPGDAGPWNDAYPRYLKLKERNRHA